ncbi:metalloproteinase [Pyricularia oryzae Y34]|uniref:Metalloproteinase n=2 Tax=Pyricularia oryzae TaxID=318829 RepID=A0AA97NX24_PYRO3|nr:metalloproteinase [Pyricularia oryzae Y34]
MYFAFAFIYLNAAGAIASTAATGLADPRHYRSQVDSNLGGHLNRRAHLDGLSECPDTQAVQNAIHGCYDLADEGSHAARNNDKLFKVIFKTEDPDTKRHVESNFEKLKEACSSDSHKVPVTCRDPSEMCRFHGPLCMAYADRGNNQVVLCPFFFEQKARSRDITANNQDTIILHELSHLLFGFDDWGYNWKGVRPLKTRHAIKNPDSYAIFAQCARNGDCEDESDYYSDSDSD